MMLAGALFVLLFFLLVKNGVFGSLPAEDELLNIRNPLATEVFTADSVLMGKYYLQNRNDVHFAELNQNLIDALIATEDARFYEHKGIDTRSLFRVFVKTLILQQRRAGGGSTLTQQLAKNLYPRKKSGFLSLPASKFREMIIAHRLENVYSKEEIILLYLNTVPFGENTFGIKSAAQHFFNKEPSALKIEEAALLVGMLKATSSYNPRKNPEAAKERRNIVLSQITRYGYLEVEIKDSLLQNAVNLQYEPSTHTNGIAPYFREFLRRELKEWCNSHFRENGEPWDLYTDGLRVYTSLDSRIQEHAEKAVRKHMTRLQSDFDEHWKHSNIWKGKESLLDRYALQAAGNDWEQLKAKKDQGIQEVRVFSWEGDSLRSFGFIDSLKHQLGFLQVGFVVMENSNARIKAWVGGIDFNFFKYDHVLSSRQAGSAFKPLVYLAALEHGMKPCDLFPDDSIVYEDYDNWSPRNADREYKGYYSMKGALGQSVNTVSVNILMETGIENVLETVRRAGILGNLPAVPSLALGTAEVSLLELVSAYQGIANRGVRYKPEYILRIEDRKGNILYQAPDVGEGSRMTERLNAELISGMLKNAVENGTAKSLINHFGFSSDMAGKTGTTQNHSDGWFIGFTPEYTAGVWVGGELPHIAFRNISYGQGAYTALPVWAYFFQEMYGDKRFAPLQKQIFNFSEEVIRQLDCDDYYESKPFRIFKQDPVKFFRDLFRKKRPGKRK